MKLIVLGLAVTKTATTPIFLDELTKMIHMKLHYKAGGSHLAETMVSKLLDDKLSIDHIKAFSKAVVNIYATTQLLLDKLPNFIIDNEFELDDLCNLFEINPHDKIKDILKFIVIEEDIDITSSYNFGKFYDDANKEFKANCLAAKVALSEMGLKPKELQLFKKTIHLNEMVKFNIKYICEIINKHKLTPAETAVYVKLALPEEDIPLIRKLTANQIKRIELLAKHELTCHIKTEEDLNNALKLASSKLLGAYAELIEKMNQEASFVLKSYGVFKLLDVISRNNLGGDQAESFIEKLVAENGLFASYDNDLDRLAKIVQDPDMIDYWKQKFMDARHSPEEWVSLEKDLKAWENTSWVLRFNKGPYAKVEEIWPEVNQELVSGDFVTNSAT